MKMTKRLRFIVFAGIVLVFSIPFIAGATTISYDKKIIGNEFTTPYAWATVNTFDTPSTWTLTGDYEIRSGSIGTAAAPYGATGQDASNYLTVPKKSSSGSVLVADLGGVYNYLGLWWGSVDAYNTIIFLKNGEIVDSFTGTQAISPNAANGNQTSPLTNLYVNFMNLPGFDSFRLTSTQYAFEVDNIAVGTAPVPEPGTILLLGLGLAGVAVARRKFRR